MSGVETFLLSLLREESPLARETMDQRMNQNKDKTLRMLKGLEEQGLVRRLGKGPGTKYDLS